MSTTRKRTPEEVWDALEQMALDDEEERAAESDDEEAARVLALSDEALDAELSRAGIDPDGVRARGVALAETLGKSAAPAPVRRTQRTIRTRWALGLLAATLGGVALFLATRTEPGVSAGRPESPQERAMLLRDEARAACEGKSWSRCIDLLDHARDLDPEGDRAQAVQDERHSVR